MTQLVQDTIIETILEIINENGLDGLGEAVSILINEAMKVESSAVLNAGPWQRTDNRKGYANGFKDKTVASRLGNLLLKIPQVRGDVTFHPSALDKGLRSERALKIAIAEMYVQGVSTRKVASILEKMCGLEVSSTQVSTMPPKNWTKALKNGGIGNLVKSHISNLMPDMKKYGMMASFCPVRY